MLTPKENFIETIRGGRPDRFVNQYEYMALISDPISTSGSTAAPEGEMRTNDWGITSVFPKGNIGPMPVHTDEYRVLKDITCWRDIVKVPEPSAYGEDRWAPVVEKAAAVNRDEKLVTTFFPNGVFEKLHCLMGMEDALCNFYDEPEAMHALIDRLVDWEIEGAAIIAKRYHPEALFHHDDWGSQNRLFLSPEIFDEFIAPAYKKIYGFWKKEAGIKYIIHHSDSYAAPLVPFMIEAGIDVWQGGTKDNNLPELIRQFGGQISFHGGIDNGTFDKPGWTREELRAGLQHLFETAGTRYLIPGLTAGGPGSCMPGVFSTVSELIDEFSKIYF